MKDNLEVLSQYLDKEKAKELLDTLAKYDKYILKFRNKVDSLLHPVNYKVLTGIAFEQKEIINGEQVNISSGTKRPNSKRKSSKR
jgi:hypothetical protein